MRWEKKIEGARAEAEIRRKAERTRVSKKTKAKTEVLDTEKSRAEAKAKEITHMTKADIKAKAMVESEGIDIMRAGAETRENVKAEVKWNGKREMKNLGLSAAERI